MSGLSLSSSTLSGKIPSLADYKNLIKDAKVLDGDIIIRNDQLNKVNYGSGAANVFTFGLSNRRIRGTAEENFESRVKFWMALKNAAGSVLTEGDLDAIGKSLGLKIGKDGNQYTFTESQAANEKGSDALARRTIAHFIEIFEAKEKKLQQAALGQAGQAVAPQAQSKSDLQKTYIGGEYGLQLTKEQFNGIFGQMESRDLAKKFLDEALARKNITNPGDKALYAKAMGALIKECRNRFATGGASDGLFERLFSDGLGIDAIAKKVAETVTDPNFTFAEVSADKRISGGIISQDARDRIDEYRKQLEQMGSKRASELTKLSPDFNRPSDNVTTDRAAQFVSELLFNSNAEEADRAGFQGGYRIANLLLKNADLFKEVCASVKSGTTMKDGHENTYGAILSRLNEVDSGLGESFTKMVAAINAQCFGDAVSDVGEGEKFRICCIANKDKLLAAVANSKMEKALDVAAENRLSDHQFAAGLPKSIDRDDFVIKAKKMIDNPTSSEWKGKVNVKDAEHSAQLICGDKKWSGLKPEEREALAALFKHVNDHRLESKLMEKAGHSRLMFELGNLLNIYGSDTVEGSSLVLAEVLSTSLSKTTTPQSLRRMLAAGFRYSSDGKFDLSRIMLELGPMAHKLLQGADNSVDENVKATLGYIRGNLPRLDPMLVKAQLLGYLTKTLSPEELANIKGIEIKETLGAASIAETVLASIEYREPARTADVVFKLVRPDVESKFKEEKAAVLKNIDRQLQDAGSNGNGLEEIKNSVLTASSTIEKEFDLSVEYRTAVRSYAALQGDPTIMSMGLVLKDPNGQEAFDSDLQKWKNADGGLKSEFKAVKTLPNDRNPTSDEMVDYIAEKHLMMSSRSCLLSEKVEGQTADKMILDFGERRKALGDIPIGTAGIELPKDMEAERQRLVKLDENLLTLAQKSVDTLLNGKPPMLHLDLHGGNIMTDGKSVTLIDHGKEFNITEKELGCYRKLLAPGKNESGTDLKDAFKTLLEFEKKRCKAGDEPIVQSINKTLEELKTFGPEKAFNEWASWRTEKGFKCYNAFLLGMKELKEYRNLYVPTGLDDLMRTFKKLNLVHSAVENEILAFERIKETLENAKTISANLQTAIDTISGWREGNEGELGVGAITQSSELVDKLTKLGETTLDEGLDSINKKLKSMNTDYRNDVIERVRPWKIKVALTDAISAVKDKIVDPGTNEWLDSQMKALEGVSNKMSRKAYMDTCSMVASELAKGHGGLDKASFGKHLEVAQQLLKPEVSVFPEFPKAAKVNEYGIKVNDGNQVKTLLKVEDVLNDALGKMAGVRPADKS